MLLSAATSPPCRSGRCARRTGDFVAAGEGLHTLVDLVDGAETSRAGFEKVPRTVVPRRRLRSPHAGPPLVSRPRREMPGVAWDLLPMERYRAHNWHCLGGLDRQPYAALYTTLGCPYHCSFCCIQAPFKSGERAAGLQRRRNSYRYWSPSGSSQQIDMLVKRYGVRNIKIADEMFVLNRRHVLGICDRHHRARLRPQHLGLCPGRHGQGRHARPARAAGFSWLAFGIEAGAERVRADVDKAFDAGRGVRRRRARSARRESTSSATTSSACPRTTWRRCRRRSIWRSTSTASSPISTPRWRTPARRLYDVAVHARLALPRLRPARFETRRETRCRCRSVTSRPRGAALPR